MTEHPLLAGVQNWVTLVLLAAMITGYLAVVRRRSLRLRRGWPVLRTASLLAGALLVGLATASPLAHFATHDPRGHMVQHLLLGMYAPLALVLGAPVTALIGALPARGRRRAATLLKSPVLQMFGHPAVAAVLGTGSLFVLYLTPVYAEALSRPWAHDLLNVHFVMSGYLFAWSIAGTDRALRRPRLGVRVTVLLLAVAAHACLAERLYAHAGRPAARRHAPDRSDSAVSRSHVLLR